MLESIFHVKKSWLAVYETFLARADKIPLLVEMTRKQLPHSYESLLKELIVARDATSGFSLPSHEKYAAEHALHEVLEHVLEELEKQDEIKNNPIFTTYVQNRSAWEMRLNRAILEYNRALHMHQVCCFGISPRGYTDFHY